MLQNAKDRKLDVASTTEVTPKPTPNRSELNRDDTRLAQECAKLDPAEEQAIAEEGMAADAGQWPPY